jgi:hypothetical protein
MLLNLFMVPPVRVSVFARNIYSTWIGGSLKSILDRCEIKSLFTQKGAKSSLEKILSHEEWFFNNQFFLPVSSGVITFYS